MRTNDTATSDRPLRIALLSGEYPPAPGGVGDYSFRLAEALRARGHSVAALTIAGGELTLVRAGPEPESEQRTTLPGYHGLDWSPRCWPALVSALDELRPDWLHIQYQTGAYAMGPGINLLPWRLRALAGRPALAVTFHDLLVPYLFPKAGPLRAWVNRRLARDADRVVATNAADATGLHALLGQNGAAAPAVIPIGSNIPVAPPLGYNRTHWRAALGVRPDELLVAYFGLLAASKGVDSLVEALARLELPWRLLIVGGAATAPQDVAHAAAVRARVAALGLTARVSESGHTAAETVSAHLLAADLLALPFRDGASFRRGSLLAGLAHGCPLVTTIPALGADTAVLAPAAVLVPPDDPAALAAAISTLADDPAARKRLAAAGPLLAARFSWGSIAAQHEALYRGQQP